VSGIGLGFLDDMFGLGFGINMIFHGNGTARVSELDIAEDNKNGMVETKMNIKSYRAPVVGLYICPGKINRTLDGLEAGFTYRAEAYLEMIPYKTEVYTTVGYSSMMAFSILEYYTPHIFILGLAYRLKPVLPALTVSIDLEYAKWSGFRISNSKMNFIRANQDPNAPQELPELRDIFIYRIGFSYSALRWLDLLAGYYYEPSVIPDSQAEKKYNMLDNDKHVVSMGGKFTLSRRGGMGGPLQIIVAGQLQYLVERSVTKNPAYWDSYNPNYVYGGYNPTGIIEVITQW
jgi:hypothetical protein